MARAIPLAQKRKTVKKQTLDRYLYVTAPFASTVERTTAAYPEYTEVSVKGVAFSDHSVAVE